MKKVRLSELDGKRVVDAQGIEVKVPPRPQIPKLPEKSQAEAMEGGLAKMGQLIAGAVSAANAQTSAQLAALVAVNQGLVEAVSDKKSPKRWSVKVRREGGLIVDMTATPEY